jgi:hypothetical protein
MVKKTCPFCGKEVKMIPFGNTFIAVCCNQIIYVGHEPSAEEKKDAASGNSKVQTLY